MLLATAVLTTAVLWVQTIPVRAEDATPGDELAHAALSYEAPAGCPSRQAFEDLVLARLGYDAFRRDALRAVRITITRNDEYRYEGHVRSTAPDTPATERAIHGSDCDRLADALAVVVALALDPFGEAAARTAEPPREPLPSDLERLDREKPPPGEPPPPSDEDGHHAPPPPRGLAALRLGIGPFVRGSYGMLPGPGVGAGASVDLRWKALIVELAGAFDATPGDTSVADQPLFAWAASGVLGACGQLRVARGCFTGRLGTLSAEATDPARDASGRALVGSLGVRFGVAMVAKGVDWSATLAAEVALGRTELRFADRIAWRAPPVLGILRLGAAFLVNPP